jgi:hypothetical protein
LLNTEDNRVLILHPGSGDNDISCHLEPIIFANNPNFEALSYVWGDGSPRKGIQCGSGTIDVTLNLYSALRHLRLPDCPRRIWIDALCINQADLTEKSVQVKNMGRIYQIASRTLIWLGEETPSMACSFNAFQTALSFFPPDTVPEVPSSQSIAEFAQLKSVQLRTETDFNAIAELLCHPWFTRKWILQEAILAKSATAMCGFRTIDWNIIEKVVIYFRIYQVHLVVPELTARLQASISSTNVFTMMGIKNFAKNRLYKELLFLTCGFECTDPRDQYFAIFGMAEDKDSIDPALHPNYSITFSTLTFHYVQWSLESFKSLDFLVCVGKSLDLVARPGAISASTDHGLPSWCPDFSRPRIYYIIPEAIVRFNASKGSELASKVDFDKKQLHISGKLLDEVQALTKPQSKTAQQVKEEMTTESSLEIPVEIASFIYRFSWVRECRSVASNESVSLSPEQKESLARTLVWDLDSQGARAQKDFSQQINKYLNFAEKVLRLYELGVDPKDYVDESSWKEGLRFGHLVDGALLNSQLRRIGRTKGGCLGSMPGFTEVGDKICIFYGGTFCYVIRPCNDGRYKFIGECYLDGFMDGEAMGLDIESETFVLM